MTLTKHKNNNEISELDHVRDKKWFCNCPLELLCIYFIDCCKTAQVVNFLLLTALIRKLSVHKSNLSKKGDAIKEGLNIFHYKNYLSLELSHSLLHLAFIQKL